MTLALTLTSRRSYHSWLNFIKAVNTNTNFLYLHSFPPTSLKTFKKGDSNKITEALADFRVTGRFVVIQAQRLGESGRFSELSPTLVRYKG